MARRDTGRFPCGPLSSEFVKPRKIFHVRKILLEKVSHLHVDASSLFRIRDLEISIYKLGPVKGMRERRTRRVKLPQVLEVQGTSTEIYFQHWILTKRNKVCLNIVKRCKRLQENDCEKYSEMYLKLIQCT